MCSLFFLTKHCLTGLAAAFCLLVPVFADEPPLISAPRYQDRDVTFTNTDDGISLEGTLSLPCHGHFLPGVLLISGSGPQDRDLTIGPHQPFRVLAHTLASRGIAVLRYDDRGVGSSQGASGDMALADVTADATAAVDYLKRHPRIDPFRITLIGHSEGAAIAGIIGASDPHIGGLILLAPSGLSGCSVWHIQSQTLLHARGVSPAIITRSLQFQAEVCRVLLEAPDTTSARMELRHFFSRRLAINEESPGFPAALPDQARQVLAQVNWLRSFLDYDPVETLLEVDCPVLVIMGSRDLFFPPSFHGLPLTRVLSRLPDNGSQILELADHNHLLQRARTGLPSEYTRIDHAISCRAIDAITQWIMR